MKLQHIPLLDGDVVAIDPVRFGTGLGIASGGYALSCDAATKLVHIAITGFWTANVMRDFGRDLFAEVRKVDAGANSHAILCDLSAAVIQSQETFEAFRALLERGPTRARKLAIITDRLAMRMQAKRLLTTRNTIAIFADKVEAMRWLQRSCEA